MKKILFILLLLTTSCGVPESLNPVENRQAATSIEVTTNIDTTLSVSIVENHIYILQDGLVLYKASAIYDNTISLPSFIFLLVMLSCLVFGLMIGAGMAQY